MAVVTKDEIRKLARISQLDLTDSEMDTIMIQVEAVLSYAIRVQQIAAESPQRFNKNINVFRDDVAIPSQSDAILSAAPVREGDFFVVPAILEHK